MSDLVLWGRILTGEEAEKEFAEIFPQFQEYIRQKALVPVHFHAHEEVSLGQRIRYKGGDMDYAFRLGESIGLMCAKRELVYKSWEYPADWETVES